MLTSLDIFTLGVCSTLASTAFGTVFFALWRRRRSERHLIHWALSNWFYAVVLLGLALNASQSLLMSCALFALMGFTDVLVVSGVYRLDEEHPFRRWMIAPPIATMLGHALPRLLAPGVIPAEVSEALGLATAMGICGGALLRERVGFATSRGRKIAGLALMGYLPGYASVIAIRLWFPESSALLPRIPMLCDQLLLGILNLALLAIPTERAHERLRQAASLDALTGVWNRGGLKRFGPDLLAAGGAVIAVDIDHFKAINDKHGHSAGDAVLVAISQALAKIIEPHGGGVFRVGGDELVAIVPNCGQAEAERLVADLTGMDDPALRLPPWSLSIGVALIDGVVPALDGALRQADLALYEAKAQGRDRAHYVVVSSPG